MCVAALLLFFSPSVDAKKREVLPTLGPPAEVIGSPFWSSHEDFPSDALVRGSQGTAGIRLSVDAAGHVYRCVVESSSGSASLDTVTCTNALKRAHFNPARDEQGQPIYGSYSFYTTWMNPNVRLKYATAFDRLDVVLTVNRLPSGSSLMIWIRQIVEADGKISACHATDQRVDEALVRAACNFLATQETKPVGDADDVPVRAVVATSVGFKVGSTH